MIKRGLWIVLVLCLFLTACGRDKDAPSTTAVASDSEAITQGSITTAQTDAPTTVVTTTQTETTTAETSGDEAITQFSPSYRGIAVGMVPEQMLQKIKELDIALIMPDYDESPFPEGVPDAVEDGRRYNGSDFSFYYLTEDGMTFVFGSKGLFEINTNRQINKNQSTDEGLKVGDSIERMEEIYGKNYRKDIEDYPVYQYYNGKEYLDIFYDHNTVTSWGIRPYSNINND